jgi:uncharacterized protein (DUF1684 family)
VRDKKGMIMDMYMEFRKEKDEFFARDPRSPLTREQKKTFQGLSYFPPSEAFRFDLEVEEFAEKPIVMIQTSTGDVQEYERYGKFRFTIQDQPVELTLYRNEIGYFLPFADSLAGVETYPAGRYLEPEPLGGRRFLLDFNFAYNPYCAYNENWSCPLTPPENRLKVAIPAGEKIFPHPAGPAEG